MVVFNTTPKKQLFRVAGRNLGLHVDHFDGVDHVLLFSFQTIPHSTSRSAAKEFPHAAIAGHTTPLPSPKKDQDRTHLGTRPHHPRPPTMAPGERTFGWTSATMHLHTSRGGHCAWSVKWDLRMWVVLLGEEVAATQTSWI